MSDSLEKFIESSLERHLKGPDGRAPEKLRESMRYSLLAPGKRIRPRLGLACAEMLGLKPEAALCAAAAIEMIHCFTLIHDDLPCMDDDDFRRGRPSNHRAFDEATALLAGDGLIAVAIETLLDAESHVDSRHVLRALRRLSFAMGPRGVIGGQAEESVLGPDSRLEDLERMHAGKTGALFSAALLLPKDLAGVEDHSPGGRAIAEFAAALGLAFQVVDDLEDAEQDSKLDGNKQASSGENAFANILHHLSPSEARQRTLAKLRSGMDALSREWKSKAEPLLRIAREVSDKLES